MELEEKLNCTNCKKPMPPEAAFCPNCGFPEKGTDEEKGLFRARLSRKKNLLEEANKRIRTAKTIIYVVAALTFLMGMIMGFGQDDYATMIGAFIVCIVYLGLAAWSSSNPFPAILTAFILYATLILLDAIVDPATIARGIIIKGLIIAGFVKGIQSARQAQQLMKELQINND